jgi:hypothetical protein
MRPVLRDWRGSLMAGDERRDRAVLLHAARPPLGGHCATLMDYVHLGARTTLLALLGGGARPRVWSFAYFSSSKREPAKTEV